MNLQELQIIAEDMIEEYDLDYGNAEVDLEDEYMYIEAPSNTTIALDMQDVEDIADELQDEYEAKRFIAKRIIDAIRDFDPNETFKEIWNEHCGIEPFDLMDKLRDDEEILNELEETLRKEY